MNDVAFLLDVFQSSENKGQGIASVRTIVRCLYQGDWDSACSVRQQERDKTRSHAMIEELLAEIFGCRLHCKKNCDSWICTRKNPIA